MTVSGSEQLTESKKKILKLETNDESLQQIRRKAMDPTQEEHDRSISSRQQLTAEEEHLLYTKPHKLNEEEKKRSSQKEDFKKQYEFQW